MKGFIKNILPSTLIGLLAFSVQAQELVGEKASYRLDRSRQRTTSLIKRGSIDSEIIQHQPNDPAGPLI